MHNIRVGSKVIGKDFPALIIAEAGTSHNGNLERAKELIDAAARAGADAVKFQSFTASSLTMAEPDGIVSLPGRIKAFNNDWYNQLKELELPSNWHPELYDYAEKKGLIFLSSCFDKERADMLDELGVPAFRFSSVDLTNIPFIKHVARKKKPMILSTGMGTLAEIEEAVTAIRDEGNDDIVLLHSTTSFPSGNEEINLRAMKTMEDAFDVPVGFSDHTFGIFAAVAAAALGASVIEKHFTIDRRLPGYQNRFAAEPDDLRWMVSGVRTAQKSLGTPVKWPAGRELKQKNANRRSLVAKADISEGEIITEEKAALITPGGGIPPKLAHIAVGRKAKVNIQIGDVITWDMI